MPRIPPQGRSTVLISHPGHELRIYGWLGIAQPKVYVLTDGSGRSNISRLGSTTKILNELGCTQGSIYGRFTDAAFYSAMLNHDSDLFIQIVKELSEDFFKYPPELVLGDAAEGYNPSHDVCRMILNTCASIVNREKAGCVKNFEFLLAGKPNSCPDRLRDQAVWVKLDAQTVKRKLKAAHGYPELINEADIVKSRTDRTFFSVECLRPAKDQNESREFLKNPPYYETYGEKRVAVGYYKEVIRYRDHVPPILQTLQKYSGAVVI